MKIASKQSLAKGRKLSSAKEVIFWLGYPLGCDMLHIPKSQLYGWDGKSFTAAGLAEARLDWQANKNRLLRKWKRKIEAYEGKNIGRFPWGLYRLESEIPRCEEPQPGKPGEIRPFKRKEKKS